MGFNRSGVSCVITINFYLSGDFILAGFDRALWPCMLACTSQALQVRQMPVPRQVPRGDVQRALGQRAGIHHEVGGGRLGHLPLLEVRVVDIKAMWVNSPLHVLKGPLAPPMWGMPALLGHHDTMSSQSCA